MSTHLSLTDRKRIKREGKRTQSRWGAFTALHFCSKDQERNRIKSTRRKLGTSSLSLQFHPLLFIKKLRKGLRHQVKVSGLNTVEM